MYVLKHAEEMVQTHAMWCSARSGTFRGNMHLESKLSNSVPIGGFSYSRCKLGFMGGHCRCYKDCGGEGGGGGGGSGGGDYPPGGGDYSAGQILITAETVDEDATTAFGLESRYQPDSSAKSAQGSPNAPASSAGPSEGASSEASDSTYIERVKKL